MERGGRGRGGADSDGEGEGVLVMEEEKEVGVVAYHVYSSYWRAVGLVLTPTILLAILLMQGMSLLINCAIHAGMPTLIF